MNELSIWATKFSVESIQSTLNHKTSWMCSSDLHDLTKSHWNLMCLYNWNQASWTCTWISRVWKYEMRYSLIKVQNHMQLIANVKMHTIYFIVVFFNHFDSFIFRRELRCNWTYQTHDTAVKCSFQYNEFSHANHSTHSSCTL